MVLEMVMVTLVLRGTSRVAGKREVQRAAGAVPHPSFDLVLLLGFREASGGGYCLSFLSLNAHSLALVLPFTASLLRCFSHAGSLPLIAVLPRMGGNARVRVEDGQV